MALAQQIQKATKLISQANHAVALTGAGVSTESGIPDFRSPDSGIWNNDDPFTVASIHAFRHNPEPFFRWIHPLSSLLLHAAPNPAHVALAKLEQLGRLTAIITQNIDNLHTKAGSNTVIELHGHIRQATCTQCYVVENADPILKKFVEDAQVPRCRHCGGVLKPNMILFGEELPMKEFVAAQMALESADLVIVAGSSLEVTPVSDLPWIALENGAQLIIINYQPTYLDDQADVIIRENVATVLPQIIDTLAENSN
jgi:NAD-dependent deacetylase